MKKRPIIRKQLTSWLVMDTVIPHITFPDPCPVRLAIVGDSYKLTIGPREFVFDKFKADVDASGTWLLPTAKEK